MVTHIVDVTLFFAPHSGGVKRYLLAKHAFLAKQPGIRHTLVVPGAHSRETEPGIVEISSPRIPFGNGYRVPLRLSTWRQTIRSLKPDLLEAGDPYHLAWTVSRLADDLGIPAVAFAHSDLSRVLGTRLGVLTGIALDRYLRSLYERFSLVMAPSQSIARRLQEIGVSDVVVQPLGVDHSVFHPSRFDSGLRRELGLAAETRLLIFAGRLAPEKQIPLLVRAVTELGDPYHLLLVGGERHERTNERITMMPYQENSVALARLLASSDALVHAGEHETFGLVFVEAMACGRPVIGVRSGAVTELIDPSVGVLAEPGNAESLKMAIRSLYDADLDAMGIRARGRAERSYLWERTFSAQLARYSALLHPRRRSIPTPMTLPLAQ